MKLHILITLNSAMALMLFSPVKRTLVEKANQWSIDNPQCLIFSCETVTWFSVDKPVFTDAGVMVKSMSTDRKTKVVRGLRYLFTV